ncbi:MAG: AAA family ATPase, partial [Fusobacterium perfoetens]|uniref:AAA family ATPase n=1 Tax=Fusobacterium perfoetens TaxID=852 RepID=UPI002A75B1E4
MKGLAIGTDDFKKIIQENCYYVDKTLFIEEILKDKSEVKLFTRPRRFGKTLNISMLKYFWDISNKEENRKLFQGLEIESSPYIEEQGKYPVIYITLKDMKYGTWKEILEEMQFLVSELFYSYQFLLKDLNEFDIPLFKNIIMKKANISELSNSLKLLSRILKNYYQKK